jgi:GTPase KRas protein
MNEHNIVLLGAGATGKSSITIQFTHNRFVAEYDPTIENNFRKSAKLNLSDDVRTTYFR